MSKRQQQVFNSARKDAEDSAKGLFLTPPYYVHNNTQLFGVAEGVVLKNLRSIVKPLVTQINKEFEALKEICKQNEQRLFSNIGSIVKNNGELLFGSKIDRDGFLRVLSNAYEQTDMVAEINNTNKLLSVIPKGDKSWGQLKQLINRYKSLNNILKK